MLEYILVRQKDQQMLQESAGRLRWIIIDEAHSYSGSAAVELAYQIKRILDAFGKNASDVRFACTSATIGGEDGTQSLAEFISSITGQPIEQIKVIGGKRLVRSLDMDALTNKLNNNNLPSADRVISLRNKINEVAGMTLQQIWEWLYPDIPYDNKNLLPVQFVKTHIMVLLIRKMAHIHLHTNLLDFVLTKILIVHAKKKLTNTIMIFSQFCSKQIGANIKI